MRNRFLLAAALGLTCSLAAQDPALNLVNENTDGIWTAGAFPTTGRPQMPSSANHPNYTNGVGTPADTWIFRAIFKDFQHVGDATTAPGGDQTRISGFEIVMQVSPSTPIGVPIAVNIPDTMITNLIVTPASATQAGKVEPDLTTPPILTATGGNATVTIAGSGIYDVGAVLVDANQNAITIDVDLEDYALCVKYPAGSERGVPATATTPSQGFAQDVEGGLVYPPIDTMNPPASIVPYRDVGYFGWDGMTQTAPTTSYVDYDTRPFLSLLTDNPTITFVADFGYSTINAPAGSVEGTGTTKHYPDFTTNTTAGFASRVYAEQFAGGLVVPFLNLGTSYFGDAILLPFTLGAGSQLTIELLPTDPLFSVLSGLVTFDPDVDGIFDLPNVPLPGTPTPAYAGLNLNLECVVWTGDPMDDRWDTTGATNIRIR